MSFFHGKGNYGVVIVVVVFLLSRFLVHADKRIVRIVAVVIVVFKVVIVVHQPLVCNEEKVGLSLPDWPELSLTFIVL